MSLNNVSEWTIWIDDVEGELAMDERDCTGRTIEVLAKEEVLPVIEQLESEKAALEKELQTRAKQIGVACLRHDLTHSLACGRCLNIAVEALKEMPCMCPEALGYSKGDKCLVCTTIATIEGKE